MAQSSFSTTELIENGRISSEQPETHPEPDTPAPKPAGRPRTADMQARQQNLIDCAACLFLQKGYGKVSLEMIAREAHVAVRTIYVKFGGKAGLFNAVIAGERARYFSSMGNMDTDTRPIEQVLLDFGVRFLKLVSTPAAVNLHRIVIAEANANPELASTFNQAGPLQTRDMLKRYFARPEIRAQIRVEVPPAMLPLHFINCIMGDQISRFLFAPQQEPDLAEISAQVAQGLELFFKAVLRA